jgi:4-carboxymuconolactone decarboxylase
MSTEPAPAANVGEQLAALLASSAFKWEAIDPAWQRLFHDYVGGGMYRREVLDAKTRDLCAIAALVVLDRQRSLQKHVLSALDDGCTREEILEVVLQMSVLGGFPVTLSALETLRELMDA